VIADLCSDLDRVIARREQLATEIETVFMTHPLGMVLVTLCGFGPRTGARTLAEIGDPPLHRWWPPRRLRRPRSRRPTIGTLHQLVVAIPCRKPPTQERHVPRSVRRRQRPDRQGTTNAS
jgi:hypothetical protein